MMMSILEDLGRSLEDFGKVWGRSWEDLGKMGDLDISWKIYPLIVTNSLLLNMTMEILDFKMVILHSYVSHYQRVGS